MHAALGDPVRLAIVDHVDIGDASPGELAAALTVPTNLLAHHLRVLEQAGLVRRVRSEGDRRRTYVQLCLDHTMPQASSPARVQASRVVFVCTHNAARSQFAAATWKRTHSVPVMSAGTQPAPRVHRRAVAVGRRHGLRLAHAKTADAADVLSADDLVIAVCDNAYEQLGTTALHWAIADPVRIDTDAAFERAYQDIARRVARLARAVTSASANPSPARKQPPGRGTR